MVRFDVREGETRERLGTGKGKYDCATRSFEVVSLMVHEKLPSWADGKDVALRPFLAPAHQ